MKPLRVVFAVLALIVPTSAHAAFIGLSGGDYDPPPDDINNIALVQFLGCTATRPHYNPAFNSGDFCAFYNAFEETGFEGISSIDFRILDGSGNFLPVGTLLTDERSDLPTLAASTLFADGFTFTLSGANPIVPGLVVPPGCDIEFCSSSYLIDSVALFASPGGIHDSLDIAAFRSSIVGVNGGANAGAAPVPEPATLLLMGPAALALLARRRKRRDRRM